MIAARPSVSGHWLWCSSTRAGWTRVVATTGAATTGCGTGAGAHHVCSNVWKNCTYEAVDMQQAAIRTCHRKFVGELGGRLKATCSDATPRQSIS